MRDRTGVRCRRGRHEHALPAPRGQLPVPQPPREDEGQPVG
ncbi:MAG: hypothetical protein OXC82_02335 [Rhodobacteraceae bacterium]|nr:hypothetical protein [Paracoccaceae bacterium]